METVLITGSKGFLGTEICKNIKGYKAIKADKDELDITKRKMVFDFFKNNKIDYIIHTAALIKGTTKDLIKVNYGGTKNIVDAAIEYGCKGIVYSSTFDIFNVSDYGASKLNAEIYIATKKHLLKSIILRYAGIFSEKRKSGVIYNFIQNAKNNMDIRYVEGETRFAYLGDVIKNNIKALKRLDKVRRLEIYDVASESIYLGDLAEMIKEMTKSHSSVVTDPIYIEKIGHTLIKATPLKKAIKKMIK